MKPHLLALGSVVAASMLALLWPSDLWLGGGAPIASSRSWPRPYSQRSRPDLSRFRALMPTLLQSGRGLVGALAIVTVLMGASPQLGMVAVGSGLGFGWFERRRAVAHARRQLNEALPESIDFCTVVLGSGGTIRDCLDGLAVHGPSPVRPLAAAAIDRASGTERLDQALRWLQLELGPAFQPLTGALLLASEQGGSVGVLLARLAVEANASRRRLGELAARRLPVALLVPLVVCSLPAVLVGTVVPLALVALADLNL